MVRVNLRGDVACPDPRAFWFLGDQYRRRPKARWDARRGAWVALCPAPECVQPLGHGCGLAKEGA